MLCLMGNELQNIGIIPKDCKNLMAVSFVLLNFKLIRIRIMFNTIFNIISVISWRLVLLVEETRVPGENQRPAASH